MRDYQEVIIKFVNIVEKYPELYNPSHDSYRTRRAELAWDKIAESIRTELNEQCTVEEIKTKWKGIRSSYIRFKNKLKKPKKESTPCKKYYLYDSLKFLEPFSKPRLHPKEPMAVIRRSSFGESGNSDDDDDSTREEFAPDIMDNWQITIKSEVEDGNENVLNTKDVLGDDYVQTNDTNVDNLSTEMSNDRPTKRKCEEIGDSSDNEDLHFFKSILPDIKDFSVKEKRKLKMGVLKLIDEIEDSRVQMNPVHEVSSTKIKSSV